MTATSISKEAEEIEENKMAEKRRRQLFLIDICSGGWQRQSGVKEKKLDDDDDDDDKEPKKTKELKANGSSDVDDVPPPPPQSDRCFIASKNSQKADDDGMLQSLLTFPHTMRIFQDFDPVCATWSRCQGQRSGVDDPLELGNTLGRKSGRGQERIDPDVNRAGFLLIPPPINPSR